MLEKKKKHKQFNLKGLVHIKTTFNNTIISVSDSLGNIFCWSSAGSCGFKGAKKSSAFAAQLVAKTVAHKALELGFKKIDLLLSGRGKGREAAIKNFQLAGFEILTLQDKTKNPFNGCRSPKKRRL